MGKSTVVPKEIWEAIKGKEVNIVLGMGAYSWSISGNEKKANDSGIRKSPKAGE